MLHLGISWEMEVTFETNTKINENTVIAGYFMCLFDRQTATQS